MGTAKPAGKGSTGNSGNASGGGWTLTGLAKPPPRSGQRAEWKAPRSGDLAHRAARRPSK